MTCERIVGPYFFENDNRRTVTVSYRKCIHEYLLPEVEDPDMHEMWFQQYEAPAHTARVTIQMLKTVFPNRLISRFGDVPWAPRSTDLIRMDFFLRGY